MVIGTANKWSLYVVRKATNPPTSSANFIDYTPHTISFSTTGGINKLGYFEATLVDVNTADELLDIAKGNLVYILSGVKLVGKFVLTKPKFNSDYTVKILGYAATGSEGNGTLDRQSLPKITYSERLGCDILGSTLDTCEGLTVNQASNAIIQLDTTNYGSNSKYYSIGFENDNRVAAVNTYVSVTNQEWWVDYGCNGVSCLGSVPFMCPDTLNVAAYQGNPTTVAKCLYFVGTTQNVFDGGGGESIESNANHVIIEGQDLNINPVTSQSFDSTCDYSCVVSPIDGWLSSCISDTATGIPMGTSAPGLYYQTCGWSIISPTCCGMIKIDNEIISFYGWCDSSTIWVDCRGYLGTTATSHKQGSDVVTLNLNDGNSPTKLKLYVVDNTFTADTCLVIGSEYILYAGCGTDGLGLYYDCVGRGWQATGGDKTHYAHGDCVHIKSCCWTPSNPAANDNSIYCNGLLTKSLSDNSPRNRHMLDMKSQWVMLNKKLPIKDICFEAINVACMWSDIDLGDWVELCDGSCVGLSDGCCVRITGWNYDFDGREKLIFFANQDTVRTYPSSSLDYVCEKQETQQHSQQAPMRTYTQYFDASDCDGVSNFQSVGNKRLSDVMTPICNFDAANKCYVDAVTSFWADGTDPYIIACSSCGVCVPIINGVTCITSPCIKSTGTISSTGDIYASAGDMYVTAGYCFYSEVADFSCVCGDTWVRGSIICADSCVCAPLITGTTCVCSLSVGATSVTGTYVTGSVCIQTPILCSTSCVKSPIIVGSTCVSSVLTCGTTCTQTPISCASNCVVSPVICGTTCVHSPLLCATSSVYSVGSSASVLGLANFFNSSASAGAYGEIHIGKSLAANCMGVIGFDNTNGYMYINLFGESPSDGLAIYDGGNVCAGKILASCELCATCKFKLPVGTNLY